MDHTEALPLDVLAGVLGRLSSRDLAVSRCVRTSWCDVVDRRLLLRLRAEHLPNSLEGMFVNYNDYPRPHFLGRPSTQHPGVDYGNLRFLPDYAHDYKKITDHCNGLLLTCWNELCVINPATRRWEHLPAIRDDGECYQEYLAFDPTMSPHYEVFMIQFKDLGLFDLTDCKLAEVPPEQLVEENFTLSSRSLSKVRGSSEVPQHSEEWPPPLLTLKVFSSSTGLWQERSFVREGSAKMRVVNVRGSLWVMLSGGGGLWGPRWRYSVYYHGALHVLHCRGAFITRLSLSSGKYQVIETPIDAKERKDGQSYLGRLGKDVYYAKIHDRIRIWTLSESSGQLDWVPKHNIGLEPLANVTSFSPEGPWILDEDPVLDRYGNNSMLAREDYDWDSDYDDILDTNDECGHSNGYFELVGFHPYKEIAFFLVDRFEAVAYHLDSSKVQYIGYLRPRYDSMTLSADDLFLYTPCMIGDLKEGANTIED